MKGFFSGLVSKSSTILEYLVSNFTFDVKDIIRTDSFKSKYAHNLYFKLFTDTFACIDNLNRKIVLYNTMTIDGSTNGLVNFIIKAFANNEILYLTSEQINDKIEFKEINKEEAKTDVGVIVIDGKNEPSAIVNEYLFNLSIANRSLVNSLGLSCKPILKYNTLRETPFSSEQSVIKQQTNNSLMSLKSSDGVMIIDSKDDISVMKLDISPQIEAIRNIKKDIASAIGVPLMYIDGDSRGSMGNNSSLEQVVLNKTLFALYTVFIYNILERVYKVNSLKVDFKFKEILFMSDILKTECDKEKNKDNELNKQNDKKGDNDDR